ncbi:MAG: hypothetical protein CVT70_17150 [Alphaproteobacteria bacterium HGW-Alphaproteobacteria-1]|jgi:hypothetical protein|nr:MAG: hypothetical protein CVT70_17150 [Alphaproteobacteria bacterium HGW-Alphaproteobacteria-1]
MLTPPLTLRPLLTAATLAVSLAAPPASAQGYPIDCAILLCLAGGFPPSAECAAAKAVMIRRITPWPIEPPLQMWRCPLRSASHETTSPATRLAVVLDAHMNDGAAAPLYLAQVAEPTEGADIDISGPEFDFIRNLKVWDVRSYSHRRGGENDDCRERSTIYKGFYDDQGRYAMTRVSPREVPQWATGSQACDPGTSTRAVGVEWRDIDGRPAHEIVHY